MVMNMKDLLRRRQHTAGLRQALDLAQSTYSLLREVLAEKGRPAIAGGWPVRFIPLPSPNPLTRFERRELRRVAAAQGAAFFDADAVQEFEHLFAERWGVNHALAVSSGTSALHIALIAGGIGPGDEVIVPVLTYVATAMAVMQAGAVPKFVDADSETWNIDAGKIEEVISDHTKAIIPVHIGGVACDMGAIEAIAEKHGLLVIEDASHAHGSTLDGKMLGTLGHMGCFSLGSPKAITTGEGGMIVTDDAELACRARIAMNLGQRAPEGRSSTDLDVFHPESRLEYVMLGWNYRMSTFQAAMGIGQLNRFDRIRETRVRHGAFLRERLGALEGLRVQRVSPGLKTCYYCFPVEITEAGGLSRGELLQGLTRERIDFRLWSNLPLASHEIFGQSGHYPVADRLCANGLTFRVDPTLGQRELEETVFATRRLLEWGRSRR
jgi:perosamine synthetase